MTLTLDLPEDILARLGTGHGSMQEESLRTFVCGLYREGRVSSPEAMRLLNLTSRLAFDTLVVEHRAQRDWTDEEVAAELETISKLNH